MAPLKRGGVYPESYQFAYRQWQERQAAGQAPVCRRTVTSACGRRTEPGYLGRIMLNVSRV